MDITLVWFQCKNPDCNYIPVKTKREKIKRYWQHGKSLSESARPRLFMRYVQGYYVKLDDGTVLTFESKYGSILMYDQLDRNTTNSYYNPLTGKELCNPCIEKIQNESLMFQ